MGLRATVLPLMYGDMFLFLSETHMAARSGCSPWLMSSVKSVWPSPAPEGLDRSRRLNNWLTPWWSTTSQNIFVVITAQNLLPKSYVVSYLALEWKLITLNQEVLGRMAFVRDLTAPLEITFWMGRPFTVLKKLRSLWESKWNTATISDPTVH